MSFSVMIWTTLIVGSLIWVIYSYTPEKLKPASNIFVMLMVVLWVLETAGVLTNILN